MSTHRDNENHDVIEKFREAFIFECAWELHSELEGRATGSAPEAHVKLATVIFNKALSRSQYAARIDLLVSMDDVKDKRREVWGKREKHGCVASVVPE